MCNSAATRWFAVCALIAILGSSCFGQNPAEKEIVTDPKEIVTDRPDITESAVVIPVGALQLESGFTWAKNRGKGTVDLSESLLRLGLASRTELRFEAPTMFANSARGPVYWVLTM